MRRCRIVGPGTAGFDPTAQHLEDTLQPPDEIFRFGADQFGRDILSRVIHGSQISLGLGSLAVILAVAIGTTIGLAAGYIGGRVDEVIMRVIDIFFAFPPIVLAVRAMGASTASILRRYLLVSAFPPPAVRMTALPADAILGETIHQIPS